MADIMTLDDLKDLIGTQTISDGLLQLYLDAAEADVNGVMGAPGESITEVFYPPGLGYESIIFLKWEPEPTTSPLTPLVVEAFGYTDAVTLADDDYRLNGTTLRRIDFGTNPGIFFTAPISVTYTPKEHLNKRKLAIVKLVNLDISHKSAIRALTVGKRRTEYQTQAEGGGYAEQREAILNSLLPSSPFFG